jgi:hypothetical protein
MRQDRSTPITETAEEPTGGGPDGYGSFAHHHRSVLDRRGATDIRGCLDHGAHCVQIDFTEGRLAVKLNPQDSCCRLSSH